MPESLLQQRIIERIQHEGAIPFAEYMRMALYEPGYGYYVTTPTKVGWEGDFYTSTDVSDLFAHCMARQLMQMWEQLGRPRPYIVLEQGAGRGHLAQQITSWTAKAQPDFHTALDYRMEDISLGQDSMSSDKSTQPISVILANELVDAFPVHIVEKRDERLYEVFVTTHHSRLHEELSEPSSAEVAHYLDHYKIPWPSFEDGWCAEINLDALRWMQRTAQLLTGASQTKRKRHGFLLTIDYGDKARALYTKYRLRGTLASAYKHRLTEQPLLRPGEQDITAHVNFSALIDEGRRQGLHLQTFTTQKAWLEQMGILDEVQQIRTRDFAIIDTAERATDRGQTALLHWYNLRQRVDALTDPMGMGNFKVLIMKR